MSAEATHDVTYDIALDATAVDAAMWAAGYDPDCVADPLSGTLLIDTEGICE